MSTSSELLEGTPDYEKKVRGFCIVFCNIILSCETWLVPHAKVLVMLPETDVESELSCTLFDVTHPGLAAVKVGMF